MAYQEPGYKFVPKYKLSFWDKVQQVILTCITFGVCGLLFWFTLAASNTEQARRDVEATHAATRIPIELHWEIRILIAQGGLRGNQYQTMWSTQKPNCASNGSGNMDCTSMGGIIWDGTNFHRDYQTIGINMEAWELNPPVSVLIFPETLRALEQ